MHAGLGNLDRFLKKHENIIISTHESPDGDGLGAEIGFREVLEKLGKNAVIINSDPVPDKYLYIDIDKEIHMFTDELDLPSPLSDYAVVVLDTNDFSNIGHAYNYLKDKVHEIFIIDHHEGGPDKTDESFIKVEASSVSEIVYNIFRYYGLTPSFKAAQSIYTGIVFDSGSFRYPKTSAETFRIAGHLVELGAHPFTVYEHIYENNSLSSFELRAMILSTMEIHCDGRLIAMKLTPEMVTKSGANFSEGELSINTPLIIQGVRASLLVKQDVSGPVKVSMRTKGELNVADLAISNGGGGHKNAAGYKSKHSLDETFQKALSDMKKLMSCGS